MLPLKRSLAALLLLFMAAGCISTEETTRPDRPASSQSAADAAAQHRQEDLLPTDPNVRIGQLENGLTYYIRRNEEPADRAALRLAVNAGSVLETSEQQGLAHFLEHMLFNGTRRFEGQELIDFLERTGMRFGPDVNAYTSFDETVYKLQVPTDTARIFKTAFDVLEDWAAYATLSEEQIDKERGVVIEEWRMRQQNAQGRIMEEILPVMLHDSRYAERLPIGDTSVVKNASYETIRQFYRDWYRPGLMGVVAVGDFDPDSVETLIKQHFSGLEASDDPPLRRSYEVPGHEETLYKVVTDPEYPYAAVEVGFKKEARPTKTVDDYRDVLAGRMFNDMLNKRFDEITNEAGSPFVSARVYEGSFVRPSKFYGLTAQVQPDSVLTGLEALLTEAERVRQHGFTPSELARQKKGTLRSYEQSYEERQNTKSSAYASEYVASFLKDEPIPGIENEYELVQRLLPEISLEEVNEQAAELLAQENRFVLSYLPDKESLNPPTEEELAAVIDQVESQPVSPYQEDVVSDAPLVSDVPAPAEVTSQRTIEEVGVTEITLGNGVRVVMKPTDFKEDEVRFTAFSPGGSSLVSDSAYFEASNAAALVIRSGVGAFGRSELQKRLAGQVVSVSPYISELEEGLRGSASPDDLKTLFQLIRLYFTNPRADSSAFSAWQSELRAQLSNRSASPQAAFQDSVRAALYGDHPRRGTPTVSMVNSLNFPQAIDIYQERFADAGDFTFIFVGNFDTERLKELARTYLGTLPSTPRQESWRDVAPDLAKGVVTKTARKGQDARSLVALFFHGPFTYTQQSRHRLRALESVLSIKLREELREKRSGVYNVSVRAQTSSRPDPTYRLQIVFSCAPDRVQELVDATFSEIEALKESPPSDEYLAKVKEQQRRERETDLESNAFWVSTLDFYYSHEDENVRDVLDYPDLIESLDAEAIQQAAQHYLDRDRYAKVVLYPEDFDQVESAASSSEE